MLVAATEYPLADSAHALMMRGLNSATLVTMRHEGAAHDSFALTLVRRACPPPLPISSTTGIVKAV